MERSPIDEQEQEAIRCHQAGRLREAEGLYRQIFLQQPSRADVAESLAQISYQSRELSAAAAWLSRAIALEPASAHLQANLGMVLAELGQVEQSIESYRRTVSLKPDSPDAYVSLGSLLRRSGQIDAAIEAYRQALALRPDFAEAWNNLGNALVEARRTDEAIDSFRRALSCRPDMPEAHLNLGSALHYVGKTEEAVACCQRVLELRPKYAAAHNLMGNIHFLGGQMIDAAAAFGKAVELDPNFVEALNNYGMALRAAGQLDLAEQVLRRTLARRPDLSDASRNLGEALRSAGRLDDAIAAIREGLARRPDAALASSLLLTLHLHPAYDLKRLFEEHVRWRKTYADPLRPRIRPHDNERSPDRRLRIGYSGANLGNHPQGRLLVPLLENHNRQQFEVFCYDNGRSKDYIAQAIRDGTDAWRATVGRSDPEIAELVRQDRIDILVDLALHSGASRMITFALKPAPVQVVYLAYCSTSGLDTIDYRMTDPYLDPPDRGEQFYSERSVWLPCSFWCYPAPAEAPPVASLPAESTGGVTFGCLNDFAKINPQQLSLWARLMRELPATRLILHAREGSHRTRLIEQLEREGVSPHRVQFAGYLPMTQYFALYNQIDIALDTFPYGGGTTSMDALWMGVPVVSRYGDTAVSRGGLSILSNIGLSDLVTDDVNEYVQIAVGLAGDLPRLSMLRSTLRQRMLASPLMDAVSFTRNMEAAYHQMWKSWCAAAV